MNELELLKKRIERERAARIQAEEILEKKALELYESNLKLSKLNESLEEKVVARTEQLAKSEQKYRSILENMELGILEVDTKGVIQKAYPRFCKLIGYEQNELIGKNPRDVFLLPEYSHVINSNNEKRIEGTSSVYEVQLQRKDGAIIWVMISGAPFYNEKGEIVGSIGVHYDITEQKRLRANLQRAKILAEKAQKAEQNFLSNMSHEIRTPLNAIIGMAHLLKDTPLDNEQIEYLQILDNSAKVLLALISDILDLTKIDTGTIEVQSKPFNLLNIIAFIEKTYNVKLDEKPVDLKISVDKAINKMLIGDELLINQILLNLLSNAEKFTEEGKIEVNVELKERTDKNSLIEFSVQDTGIGISDEKIKIIFDEFKQASSDITRKFGGSGLGLAITKKLVELLGGSIKVESEIGVGTKFWFELNFENSDLALTKEEEEEHKFVIENKSDPILIVEDNLMNQKYLTKILEKWGMTYELALNGKEATQKVMDKKYGLILMDIQMPIMSGYEATQFIRSRSNPNQSAIIIALTASTLLSKKQKALDSGMDDFLAKPFTPKQLFSVLNKYLNKIEVEESRTSSKKSDVFKLDESLLNDTYGDDYDYAVEMFETFLEVNSVEVDNLKNAFENEEKDELTRIVHKIKPTFSMVGLPEMTKFMQQFEQTTKTESWDEILIRYEEFLSLLESNIPLINAQLEIYKSK